jgi:hypothetical protein
MNNFGKSKILATCLASVIFNLGMAINLVRAQEVEGAIAEDSLEFAEGTSWGGDDFPYSKLVEIKDTLVDTPVGRVVLDRHGVGGRTLLGIRSAPFTSPMPGGEVYISLWGSKIEGCFVQLIVQRAPAQQPTKESMAPKLLELGIGGRILQLTTQDVVPEFFTGNYVYPVYTSSGTTIQNSGIWYMSRQLFAVDATAASILSSAPADNIKARITYADKSSTILPIGQKTVERWQNAYNFNPSCQKTN